MANWENFTVREIVGRISDGKVVLPVIQRRLVWETDKMEDLFDSLFQQNSFGSIICTEEESGLTPLFPYRLFTKDGNNTYSFDVPVIDETLLCVIDGQQRLQSFYIGLCGTFDGKTMYYDLFSDHARLEHNFKFAVSVQDLPKTNSERAERVAEGSAMNPRLIESTFWFPARNLFEMLKRTANPKAVATQIINVLVERGRFKDDDLKDLKIDHIRENIHDFRNRIFVDRSIGVSKVESHMLGELEADRQRVAQMFQRLNMNGTRLSTYDLVASTLRRFDYRMESFLDNVIGKNSDIGVDQDVMIKMLLVLHDKPNSGMADMTEDDATFATENIERIQATLDSLQTFLKASKHEEWFSSAVTRSAIPLYILTYHIFHQSENPAEIRKLFTRFDTNDRDFHNMSLWLKLSLLNEVFKRGSGWMPEKTGLNKLHEIMKHNRRGIFPLDELLELYQARLHHFFDHKHITPECLDVLDQEYIFYMIYGGRRSSIRLEDRDHIHPRMILERAKVSPLKISSIGNLQLIDYATNRGEKSSLELRDWINMYVTNRGEYISRHLIPDDENLWTSDRFNGFLRARLRMMADKIKSSL